eukprot:TRINITY_DN4149_c0_g3_i1.p1 TRINITY_DN4149_c0_g3~~TRINITY_DN4149_c0_g3_i1.p1  ORF type:complete len:486 (-),score=92.23 TRINITY_DN4149_c0_g3_i1:47-1504(-)
MASASPHLLQSTRGQSPVCTFREAVMSGLAPDGGLYVPQAIPTVPASRFAEWRTASFAEIMNHICALFVPENDIPRPVLKEIIDRSCGAFHHEEVTPVVPIQLKESGETLHILELFHGPTLAFKDVALQFLGNLFEYFLKTGEQKQMCVLGATSGDTGSAAIYGLKGKAGVELFMLYPKGRVSPFQETQMTSVLDQNIHNIAIEGTFDDGQAIVKQLFGDLEFRGKYKLAAVNSINWARILAQISYYFYSYFRVTTTDDQEVHFSVPTGNFGDVLAGYYAKRLGLPVGKLIVATNENDILARLFVDGDYSKKGVMATTSPSMDIQISSNLERYLFYTAQELYNHESAADTVREWMNSFNQKGSLKFDESWIQYASKDMISHRVPQAEVKAIMKTVYDDNGYVLDPHTAIGVGAAVHFITISGTKSPIVCLATAHAAKFDEAVKGAIGIEPTVPQHCIGLLDRETRSSTSPATADAIRQLIETKLS